MVEGTVNIQGKKSNSKYAYEERVWIKPLAKHYEDEGEPLYIKYSCPICKSLGLKIQIQQGIENCPTCNISLTWDGIE